MSSPSPGQSPPSRSQPNLKKIPDFFIIGAPKCGTTALTEYLAGHPDVFMARKEMHHFGSDLAFGSQIYRRHEKAYLAEFEAWNGQLLAGEASVWYLYSAQAAAEIKAFNPNARIIIMLREPAEMLYSLFQQFRVDGNEPLPTFAEALAAEEDRRAGRRFTRHTYFAQGLYYRQVASYTEQVRRCFKLFGRDRVHVVLYDDFAADTAAAYGKVLDFLGLVPKQDLGAFKVINPSHRVRSPFLRAIISDPLVRGTAISMKSWLPRPLFATMQYVEMRLMRFNFRPAKRVPIDPVLRQSLKREFATEVKNLGELLGCDLSDWCSPDRPGTVRPAAVQQPLAPPQFETAGQNRRISSQNQRADLTTCSNP